MRLGWIFMAAMMVPCPTAPGWAQDVMTGFVTPDEWASYQSHFVSNEGRVIDTANGGISHSEGQGYGMLLAYLAGDSATFDRLWRFTRTELQIRDDALLAWRWQADATPHVTDTNNASDGDILVAYALALAGAEWNDPDKTAAAAVILRALDKAVVNAHGQTLLLPALQGFAAKDHPDGPVINPSYWIYEAFPLFAQLAPGTDWAALSDDGLELLDRSRFSTTGLPSDWIALGDEPAPAEGFPPEFGYNAIRIPLYLMRAGIGSTQLAAFADIGDENGLHRVNVQTGSVAEQLTEPGYRIIQAAVACTLTGAHIPADLASFAPTTYFAATLQLLTLDHLRRRQPGCIEESPS